MLPFHFFPCVFSPLIFSRSSLVCRGLSSSSVERSTCGILSTVASRYAGFSRVKNSCLIAGTNLKALYTRDCASVKSIQGSFFSLYPQSYLSKYKHFFAWFVFAFFWLLTFRIILINLYVLWKRITFYRYQKMCFELIGFFESFNFWVISTTILYI